MANIAPPLRLILEITMLLQNGLSVKAALQQYLRLPADELSRNVQRFYFAWEQGQDWRAIVHEESSPYRRMILETLAQGLSGQSVLRHLQDLQHEIEEACEAEIQRHLALLPIKMLIPLLLFQFPAFLCLLFGPLMQKLLEEMNR